MVDEDFEALGHENRQWGIGEWFGRGAELMFAGGLTAAGFAASVIPLGVIVGGPMMMVGGAVGLNALRRTR